MREYGQVQCALWHSQDMEGTSDIGKLLAVYLLTGPHSNGLGCYLCPDGYVMEDLGWSPETVSKGFMELSRNGFAYRFERVVFLPNFLRWNKVANANVAKARMVEFLALPKGDAKARAAGAMLKYCAHLAADDRTVLETVAQTVSKPFPEGAKGVCQTRSDPIRSDPTKILTNPKSPNGQLSSFENSTGLDDQKGRDPDLPPKPLELGLQGEPPLDTKALRRAAAERIFDHWRTTHEHERAQIDDKRRKLITKALDSGYSEADLCQAITGYLNSPHHMGENDRATKYDSIELMLRGPKFIDQGLKFYAEPPRTERSKLMRRNLSATAGWVPPEMRHAAK